MKRTDLYGDVPLEDPIRRLVVEEFELEGTDCAERRHVRSFVREQRNWRTVLLMLVRRGSGVNVAKRSRRANRRRGLIEERGGEGNALRGSFDPAVSLRGSLVLSRTGPGNGTRTAKMTCPSRKRTKKLLSTGKPFSTCAPGSTATKRDQRGNAKAQGKGTYEMAT